MRGLLVPSVWILALLLVASFGYLAYRYTSLSGEGDVPIWLSNVDLAWMPPLMAGASFLGKVVPAMITAALVVAVLLFYRRWQYATSFAVILAASAPFTYLIKLLVARLRPDALLLGSFSFPSGHVAYVAGSGGFLLAGLCVAAVSQWHRNRASAEILSEVDDAGIT